MLWVYKFPKLINLWYSLGYFINNSGNLCYYCCIDSRYKMEESLEESLKRINGNIICINNINIKYIYLSRYKSRL